MASTSETSSTASDNKNGTEGSEQSSYSLGKILTSTGIEIDGARVMYFPAIGDPLTHAKSLRALTVREDDIFVAAFPKCGTHWLWEVTQMLIKQSAEYQKQTKEQVMMEFSPVSVLDAEPSPRVFNSHLFMTLLPQEIITKKPKIIHVVRNPKDTFVSFFFHTSQMPGSQITFQQLLKIYMDNNVLSIAHQFDYLRQMQQFEKAHPDVPVKVIYYEKMKKEPVKTVKELAEFLKVPATDTFCEDVALACSFDKMKAMDENRDLPEHIMKSIIEGTSNPPPRLQMYRKGTVGDWKNHFTVAQNEVFEEFIARETAKGLDYTFIYE